MYIHINILRQKSEIISVWYFETIIFSKSARISVWSAFRMSGKAQEAAANLQNGQKKQIRKVRHFRKFAKPAQPVYPKKPLYQHKAVEPVSLKRNAYKIIQGPVRSDKADRKAEEDNTLVFWVDIKATKQEIANACKRLFEKAPVSVNTLITSKCLKKAYIRLPPDVEAANLLSEAGFAN